MEEDRDDSSIEFRQSLEQKGGYPGSTMRQQESPLTYVTSKNSEFEPNLQKYKGRVVLWGDSVKDDSGAYAVFSEQGSSSSQMTAAKIMDVIARLPGCDGQAADAVSANTQVKWEVLPDCSKFNNRNVRMLGYVFHHTKGQNHGETSKIPWYLSNDTCTVIRLLASCGKDTLRKFYWDLDGKKYRIGNVWSFIGNTGYFCQYMWMTSKWLDRSRMWRPCGRN